ncbi:hypothetical protein J6590_022908 [Homalodisca vitripennis]|nr:hypothetical protein J6590_022908 [Homalodisca vitripennis]
MKKQSGKGEHAVWDNRTCPKRYDVNSPFRSIHGWGGYTVTSRRVQFEWSRDLLPTP